MIHASPNAELSRSLARNAFKLPTHFGLPDIVNDKPEASFEYAAVPLHMGLDPQDLLAHR